jgi:hypothetical protein
MSASGTAVTRLTNNAAKDLEPAWSPDGTKVVFSSTRDMLEGDVYTINAADGTGVTRLTFSVDHDGILEAAFEPAWSPNGSTIAYTKQTVPSWCPCNPTEIWSMNADGSGQHSLDPQPYSDPPADEEIYYDGFPNWSPDGTKIAFTLNPSSDPPGPNPGIYTMTSTGSGTTQITTSRAAPAWSPDGTKIAYGSSTSGIHIVNPDGTGATTILSGAASNLDWQPITTGYPRPKGATPVHVELVPAYQSCVSPNRVHAPPLAFASCNPPVRTSPNLTLGTPDANGQPAKGIADVKLKAIAGDFAIDISLSDVRNASDLSDYTGELQLMLTNVRTTDRNSRDSAGGSASATMVDLPFPPTFSCAATADTTVGSTCNIATTANAFIPGMIVAGKRAVWEFRQVTIQDGGPDGVVATADNSLFMVQGIFTP